MIDRSENRSRYFKSLIDINSDIDISLDGGKLNVTSQIEKINKQDSYRILKRKRDTREASLFNKMNILTNKIIPTLKIKKINTENTGLQWDNKEDIDTIVRKGKLNPEGIKYVKMNKNQKHLEINKALKDMIKQKEIKRISERELSKEQLTLDYQVLYMQTCPELF